MAENGEKTMCFCQGGGEGVVAGDRCVAGELLVVVQQPGGTGQEVHLPSEKKAQEGPEKL